MTNKIKKHSKRDYKDAVDMMANDVRELTKLVQMGAILLKNLGHLKEANRLMYALTADEEFKDDETSDRDRHRESGDWKELKE